METLDEVRLVHPNCEVTIRAFTEVQGDRLTQRMRTAWQQLPDAAFTSMVEAIFELGQMSTEDLRQIVANRLFRYYSGRTNDTRFEFHSATLITSTQHPGVILILIEISHAA